LADTFALVTAFPDISSVTDIPNVSAIGSMQFTALSGRHSVLERPLSGENGRPFLVITPEIIGY